MEEISFRTSRKAYIFFYLIVALMLIYSVKIYLEGDALKTPVIIAGLIFILIGFKITEIGRLRNLYILNDDSIIYKKGIIKVNKRMVFLNNISDVILIQGPWNRLLNYGSVELFSFGDTSSITVKKINRPARFTEEIKKRILGWGESPKIKNVKK